MFISHGTCVRRDISSSGAFLFLSLSLFFFYAATNTCFEAGHAFSKAIRLASATMLYESTCVERGNGERETDAAGR